MIADVRSLNAASTAAGSMHEVRSSISTNTGVAPTLETAAAVAYQPRAGTITSRPGPARSARSATSRADEPELTVRANRLP